MSSPLNDALTDLLGLIDASPERDWYAPGFAVYVNGVKLQEDITQFILHVRYEESVEMASKLDIDLDNSYHRFTDSPLFAPDVDVDVYFGYGNNLVHFGRAELHKHLPTFPESGAPTLSLVGYDQLVRMNTNELAIGDDTRRKEKERAGTTHKGYVGNVVAEIFKKYDIWPDGIDADFFAHLLPGAKPTEIGHNIQKADTPDSEYLRALANFADAEMFVRWEFVDPAELRVPSYIKRRSSVTDPLPPPPGRWVGYFRKPPSVAKNAHCQFFYNDGDHSTILRCDLEFAITGRVTEVTVQYLNKETGEYESVTPEKEKIRTSAQFKRTTYQGEFPAAQLDAIDRARVQSGTAKYSKTTGKLIKKAVTEGELAQTAGIGNKKWRPSDKNVKRTVIKFTKVRDALPGTFDKAGPASVEKLVGEDGEITEYHPIRILVGKYSFGVNPGRKFRSAKEANDFAEAWFKKYRDSLIIAHGSIIGYEKLRAGTVHRLVGIGRRYSGDYYFVHVEQEFDADTGFRTNFVARKMLD